jgi:hypothetical protein
MESPNRPNNADPLLFRYVATAEESNQPSITVVLSVQGALIGGQIISAALYAEALKPGANVKGRCHGVCAAAARHPRRKRTVHSPAKPLGGFGRGSDPL